MTTLTLVNRFTAKVAAAILLPLTRPEVQGREHIPRSGPLILVSNHLSHLDPPLLGWLVGRTTCFMAKEELFRVPLLGWWIRKTGAFPVKRGMADRAALRRAQEVLAQGYILAIFPEGHRSEDGHLQAAEDGAGLIAVRSRAPILPAAVIGTNRILPPHALWPRPGKVTVRFGPVFSLDDLYGQTGREPVTEATRRIMAAIAALLPPEHQPRVPDGQGATPAG